jgi:hypothetical protein
LASPRPAGMLSPMEEIARFLAQHPPFDRLPPELLAQTAGAVEIEYFARGARILRQGGEASRFLYLIVKGTVELWQATGDRPPELVETLAVGETFGQLSLLSGAPHLWDAVAREDVLAYLIPPARWSGCNSSQGSRPCWPSGPATASATPSQPPRPALRSTCSPLQPASCPLGRWSPAPPTIRWPRRPGRCATSTCRR